MLDKALEFLRDQLNADVKFSEFDPKVIVVKPLVDGKGEVKIGTGEVGIILVNIDEERIFKPQLQKQKRDGDSITLANPEIKLNLHIVAAVNPGDDNYIVALNRLSNVIAFFQGTSYFDKTDYPDLDPIEYLIVELNSLTFEQQNQLWASLGAKYMPSVVYRVRLVVIDKDKQGESQRVITEIDNNLNRIN